QPGFEMGEAAADGSAHARMLLAAHARLEPPRLPEIMVQHASSSCQRHLRQQLRVRGKTYSTIFRFLASNTRREPAHFHSLLLKAACTLQSRTVPSQLPDASSPPSGLNITDRTQYVCPRRVAFRWPVATSHSFTVWSSLPDAKSLP